MDDAKKAMPTITWQERLDLTLPIKELLRRARDIPRFDDREGVLRDLMWKAIDLPPEMRGLAREAAIFAASQAHPEGEAMRLAATCLTADLESPRSLTVRPRSLAERLLRALEAGGMTRDDLSEDPDRLQDELVDSAARLFRRLAIKFPDATEKIARSQKQGMGIMTSRTFDRKLWAELGPDFVLPKTKADEVWRNGKKVKSTYGKPKKVMPVPV